jgi:hypothetical protein
MRCVRRAAGIWWLFELHLFEAKQQLLERARFDVVTEGTMVVTVF